MADKELLLGIDLGTSGCKVTLIDTDCNFIGDGYTEYPTYHPNIGWSEQDPADWFPAFMHSFGIALEKGGVKASQVVALSLDASAHNIVLLDRNNRVLRKTIMWTDTRATEESAFMAEHYGSEIFRIGYQMPSPTWSMLQLMWIKKHEPEVMEKAVRAMFVKDYVRYQLTGTWTTDHVEAQGSLLFDNINWCWSEDLCRMSEIPISILPPLVKPTDIAGHVTNEAAAITGIPAGTPVINGSTDTALEAYCVGAIHENNCVTKLATSGTIYLFRKEAHPDPKALTYSHVVDGLWYTCLATSSAAESLRWYRDTFCKAEFAQEQQGGENTYRILDEEAERVPAGCEGLLFHPYLMGERSPYWDTKLRGSFIGATAHHDRGHFNRAVLEGVAFSIKDNFSLIENTVPIHEVRIVGGGGKSPLWRSIMANVLNRPILKYANDDSSYGSALLAGVGAGIFSSHEQAVEKGLHLKERVEPDAETAAKYQEVFQRYREIHDALTPVYHRY